MAVTQPRSGVKMDRKRLKFILLGAGILLSMGFLLVVGVNRPGGFSYYLSVSEFLGQPDRGGDGFRINGKVDPGSIERMPTGEDVTFVVTDGNQSLRVAYHGIIPDTFVDGADVVVEGRLEDDGAFHAHTLLAKCPSKYESADDGTGAAPALEAAIVD
jgi:cytochrome c-type biogenesis protein CcmE